MRFWIHIWPIDGRVVRFVDGELKRSVPAIGTVLDGNALSTLAVIATLKGVVDPKVLGLSHGS